MPACELVRTVRKPASRAPSVQGMARPGIWVSSELSILLCRGPLSAKMVIMATLWSQRRRPKMTSFPVSPWGRGRERWGGAEGSGCPTACLAERSPPARRPGPPDPGQATPRASRREHSFPFQKENVIGSTGGQKARSRAGGDRSQKAGKGRRDLS